MSTMHAFARDSSDDSSGEEEDFLNPSAGDDFADFNPRKRRRTGRDAKESAALGVFGSESEDEGREKKWKRKDLRGRGTAFVSAGQKTMEDEEEYDDDEEEDDDDVKMEDAPEQTNERPGLGAPKIGFNVSTSTRKSNGSGTPLGKGFIPSSATVPVLNDTYDEVETPRISRPSAFSTPSANKKGGNEAPAGSKMSFAQKMMAKMGYKEGQGLGKDATGRTGVIEVVSRPSGAGLGAVREKSQQEREEEKRQAKLKGVAYEDSDEERKKKPRKQRSSGMDSGVSTPRRKLPAKPKYQTFADVQKAAPELQVPEVFSKILDMRGPTKQLLTSSSGLMTPTANTSTDNVEQAESKKLVRRAQADLSAFVEEVCNLRERKAFNSLQATETEQGIAELQLELQQIRRFSQDVDTLTEKDAEWESVLQVLESADGFSLPQHKEILSDIAVSVISNFLRQWTQHWQPLEDRNLGGKAPDLFKIRNILGALNKGSHRTTAYESMIYKIIFPKLVQAISQNWIVYQPEPALALLDAWDGLLPQFVKNMILEQAVVGKLNDAVSAWRPRTGRSRELPHLWLFPWLQYLPAHHADPNSSTGLVTDVKRKFRQVIDTWDYKKGLIEGVDAWRDVLRMDPRKDHWQSLVMHHIVPSMSRFLGDERNFSIAPEDQEPYMRALEGVLSWVSVLGPRMLAQVVVEKVFPKLMDTLHLWLVSPGCNYEEVGAWYLWWSEAVFPREVREISAIQTQFDKLQALINQALDLGTNAAHDLPKPKQAAPAARATPPPPAPVEAVVAPVEEVSFKDTVLSWCIENELQCISEKKQLHALGPLYRITASNAGKNGALVYFRGDSLWAVAKTGDIRIDWESEDARDALLGMAYTNVK